MDLLLALFAQPLLLLVGPAALVALWLLERWRRRPIEVVVADLDLFEATPEVEAEASARRRRVGVAWLLRALAAAALSLAAAGLRLPPGPGGPVTVDLVLDRGVTSAARGPGAGTRLDRHRAHLEAVLDRLGPADRVRLHRLPAPAGEAAPAPVRPATAREVLDVVAPAAARADVAGALARLAPRGVRGGPPVFAATDGEPDLPPALAAGVAVARAGVPVADRGIAALVQDEAGALHATVAAFGAPGEAEVVLRATGADGRTAEARRTVPLPDVGFARVAWTPEEGLPTPLARAEAALAAPDALPLDDRAFAIAAAPARRVGLHTDPGPFVRRALAAVPGVALVDLGGAGREEAARVDLLVVPGLRPDQPLPPTAVIVVPRDAGDRAGGAVAGRGHPAFAHTLAAVAAEPFVVRAAGELPRALGADDVLLRAGDDPFLAVSGAGRRLVAAATAPLRREVTPWVDLESFPLFWAELLDLAAPRSAGRLAAHPAGEPWAGSAGQRLRPLAVGVFPDPGRPDGPPAVGTVAALPGGLADVPAGGARPFPAGALDAIDAARPVARPRPLAPLLAALALGLALASWFPGRPAAATDARDRIAA